jgi:hypothetical protein
MYKVVYSLSRKLKWKASEIYHFLYQSFPEIKNIDLLIKVGPRRKGDLETSVLANVSPYMKELYSLEELVKV